MLANFITDPGFVLTLRWLLASVFLIALVHKLKEPAEFRVTLEDYQLLPVIFLRPAFFALVATELVVVCALLANTIFGGIAAVALLSVYTLAIGINLIRGRTEIDCGCSGPAVRQTLSIWLVVRNIGLITLALITFFGAADRVLGILDWFTSLAAASVFALIYSTAAQLSTFNRAQI